MFAPAAPWPALMLSLTLLGVLALVALAGVLAAAAAALSGASRTELAARAAAGEAGAARALALARDSQRLLAALRLGSNAALMLAAALVTLAAARGGVLLLIPALAALLALSLLLVEVLPRSLAARAPARTAILLARPVGWLVALLAPAIALARRVVHRAGGLFGLQDVAQPRGLDLREEILSAIALGRAQGTWEKEDRDRLLGALDLGERTVEEAMRHRSAIEMLDADLPLEELIERALSSTHSRLPLYRDDPENIVGVLHSKDLMRALHAAGAKGPQATPAIDVLEVAQKPWFVPETTALDAQMRQFLKRRRHFALVVDEYGTLQGLITLEDILEEIVGEIADEYDTGPPPLLRREAGGAVVVEGTMTVRDFNRATDWNLPDEEANTLAGLLIHEAQTIPQPGQQFQFFGCRFEVLQRKGNRLSRLRIHREPEVPRAMAQS